MSTVAELIVTELREAHPGRSVEVDIKEGITAFADYGLIEVVLSNLLGNAWKFTAKTEHARIEFGSAEREGKCIYYIRDNGAGFDQNYAGKMFWPFHRLHPESAFEGTGIGLAIVDRIIRLHGGKVWAEGIEGKRGNDLFPFELSLSIIECVQCMPISISCSAGWGKKRMILIVDDSPTDIELTTIALEATGREMSVCSATDGQSALAMLRDGLGLPALNIA